MNGEVAPRWAVRGAALTAAVAIAVVALARWEQSRFDRAGALTIARSTAAYFTVVTPPARADSGDLDLVQLLVQARALTTLPGWTSPVEIYHGTAPLVDAAAPPLPAAELERLPEWRDGTALVALRGRSDGAGEGPVVGPAGRAAITWRPRCCWGSPRTPTCTAPRATARTTGLSPRGC